MEKETKEIKEEVLEPVKKTSNTATAKDKINILYEAHPASSIKDEIEPGTKFTIVGTDGDFKKVSYTKNDKKLEGYIYE